MFTLNQNQQNFNLYYSLLMINNIMKSLFNKANSHSKKWAMERNKSLKLKKINLLKQELGTPFISKLTQIQLNLGLKMLYQKNQKELEILYSLKKSIDHKLKVLELVSVLQKELFSLINSNFIQEKYLNQFLKQEVMNQMILNLNLNQVQIQDQIFQHQDL